MAPKICYNRMQEKEEEMKVHKEKICGQCGKETNSIFMVTSHKYLCITCASLRFRSFESSRYNNEMAAKGEYNFNPNIIQEIIKEQYEKRTTNDMVTSY